MDSKTIDRVKKIIGDADQILVTSHFRPDGDAIGSVLGLGLALKAAGKQVQMVLVDGVPKTFCHLSGFEQVTKHIKEDFDTSFVLDCSDLERVGNIISENIIPTLNIDHHKTNLMFAQINIVDQEVPATTEILYDLIPSIGLEINKPVGEALLTGILTDTLGLRTSNIRPKTLRVVAELMEIGCDLPYLYRKVLINRSFESAKFWGAGLSTLQKDGRLVWATLTQEDRKIVGYPGNDDADLINVLSSLDDIDVAVIFVEQGNEKVKVSWRANNGFDVSQIATDFGGGGHRPAAGAEIFGNLDSVKTKVLNATNEYLKKNSHVRI
jgi:phosphoesterase RecJ-like protein